MEWSAQQGRAKTEIDTKDREIKRERKRDMDVFSRVCFAETKMTVRCATANAPV